MTTPRNVQSGTPVAESTLDPSPQIARGHGRDGTHYEPDPDQIVKVVHQVRPAAIPPAIKTDYDTRGGPQPETSSDVRVTPNDGSVHEAGPRDG